MKTAFFYISLKPVQSETFIFSKVIAISYSEDTELGKKQDQLGHEFSDFLDNVAGSNLLWSTGYATEDDASATRWDEIQFSKAAGDIVEEKEWP
jgi:hypothetical protein